MIGLLLDWQPKAYKYITHLMVVSKTKYMHDTLSFLLQPKNSMCKQMQLNVNEESTGDVVYVHVYTECA